MILIALGSNLPSKYGSPEETLEAAKRVLEARGVRIVRSSENWASPPFPPSDQPWFSNAVMQIETDLSVRPLLKLLKEIERDFGRESAERNAARILDLDIIAYGDEIYSDDSVRVPHPRMYERAFVLFPLQEVAPGWIHPVMGRTVEKLIEDLSPGQFVQRQKKEAI